MRTRCLLLAAFLLPICLLSTAKAQPFNTLYPFTGQSDGSNPQASLILSGYLLYGTASSGGNLGISGSIFAVDSRGILTNLYQGGADFTNLYDFSAGETNSDGLYINSDGAKPMGSLVLSGNTLFGTASAGGASGYGTVFSVTTNGAGFKTLYTFTNGVDGGVPMSGLVLAGNTLFGTASQGGSAGQGTVFSLNTNGTHFTPLHSFTGQGDGSKPQSTLVLSGANLYGTASGSGGTDTGVVFSMSTNGSTFFPIHQFSVLSGINSDGLGTNSDGAYPVGGVILSGDTLFGTASAGGGAGYGSIFSVSTTGAGFTSLYTFTNGNDGANPLGGLALSGDTLYGTASTGVNNLDNNDDYLATDTNGFGGIFSITNGANFTSLYGFTGGYDGFDPVASLIVSDGTLYGTAYWGGYDPYDGSVFSLSTTAHRLSTLLSFNGSPNTGANGFSPEAGLVLSGDMLYGTASAGGAGAGSVFALTTNGTGLDGSEEIGFGQYSFSPASNGTNFDGVYPVAPLLLSGSTLYGTASAGGPSGFGTVFALNTNYFTSGTGFQRLYAFTNGTDGASPSAGLILSGSTLYGTTAGTGGNSGTVFALSTSGAGFQTLHTFSAVDNNLDNSDGANPMGGLVLSGNTLYGTASAGGTNSFGTIFAVNTSGTVFATLHNFAGPDGIWPAAGLVLSGNTLYGTTSKGGISGGTVFSLNLNTVPPTFITLYSFTSDLDGSRPLAGLLLSGSTLYGTTTGYGLTAGTIFAINTNGTGFTALYDFAAGSDGSAPQSGLILSGNTLFGTATGAGFVLYGTVFGLNISSFTGSSPGPTPIPLNIQISGTNVILTWHDPASVFSLQAASTVNGLYTNVPGAASPFTNAIGSSPKFFRLEAPN